MSQLRKFQQEFHTALLDQNNVKNIEQLIDSNGISADKRINVYRNNFKFNLTEALRSTFPVIYALLGEQAFTIWSYRFIAEAPSTEGNLHNYGVKFPKFIQQLPEYSDLQLPYLVEIGEFEWAYHEVFHETEIQPIKIENLASVNPSQYNEIVFEIHPASRLLKSNFPLIKIWRLGNGLDSDEVDLDAGGVSVLIARRELTLEFQQLSNEDYNFLRLTADGHTLGAIVDTIGSENPDFNLQECLQRQFQRNNFSGFYIET